ncbi:hypothetical protein [Leptolyngbya sp. FACHB-261]|uniref:hypothetical protein n=1 Tax=Leptolyngbya sp. FACHB-261 TaxID=2692806 RepID=UPI001682635C|nr:hypothetical protein [Leptolyngbya sp. FACHB-261]MBD2100335.1 hypothetical protein [Leptolyngbya sp. FACHB-261]
MSEESSDLCGFLKNLVETHGLSRAVTQLSWLYSDKLIECPQLTSGNLCPMHLLVLETNLNNQGSSEGR